MLNQYVDIKAVSKLLGHASIKTTEIYAEVTNKNLSDIAARFKKVSAQVSLSEQLMKNNTSMS